MLKAIFYKEWLKIKVTAILATLVGLFFILQIYLDIKFQIEYTRPQDVVFTIIHKQISWFENLKFIPVIIGSIISIVQFYPEVINNRIKLSFHLPVGERKVLFQMLGFGFGITLIILSLLFSHFIVVCNIFLPQILTFNGAISVAPWFLGGVMAYLWVAFIVLEPTWKHRIYYSVIGVLNVSMFLLEAEILTYAPFLKFLTTLTIISGFAVLFSAYRLKKGLR